MNHFKVRSQLRAALQKTKFNMVPWLAKLVMGDPQLSSDVVSLDLFAQCTEQMGLTAKAEFWRNLKEKTERETLPGTKAETPISANNTTMTDNISASVLPQSSPAEPVTYIGKPRVKENAGDMPISAQADQTSASNNNVRRTSLSPPKRPSPPKQVPSGDQQSRPAPVVEPEDIEPGDAIDYVAKLREICVGDVVKAVVSVDRTIREDKHSRILTVQCMAKIRFHNKKIPTPLDKDIKCLGYTQYRTGDSIGKNAPVFRRSVNRAAKKALEKWREHIATTEAKSRSRLDRTLLSHIDEWKSDRHVDQCYKAFRRTKDMITNDSGAKLSKASVFLFGSACTGMILADSDIDVAVILPFQEVASEQNSENDELLAKQKKVSILNYLRRVAQKRGMEDVYVIASAKVPVLRYFDNSAQVDVDVTVTSDEAMLLSRVMRSHLKADRRVWEVSMAIKYWARRRSVSGVRHRHINPMGWTIMVIYFLQHHSFPRIGALYRIKGRSKHALIERMSWNSSSCAGLSHPSTGELTKEFFRFYGYKFDFAEYAISLNFQHPQTISDTAKRGEVNYPVFIEQPLHCGINVVGHVSVTSLDTARAELRRAYQLCVAHGDFSKISAERNMAESTYM